MVSNKWMRWAGGLDSRKCRLRSAECGIGENLQMRAAIWPWRPDQGTRDRLSREWHGGTMKPDGVRGHEDYSFRLGRGANDESLECGLRKSECGIRNAESQSCARRSRGYPGWRLGARRWREGQLVLG